MVDAAADAVVSGAVGATQGREWVSNSAALDSALGEHTLTNWQRRVVHARQLTPSVHMRTQVPLLGSGYLHPPPSLSFSSACPGSYWQYSAMA